MTHSDKVISWGTYDERIKTGNLTQEEVQKLVAENTMLRAENIEQREDLKKTLYQLRLIARSGSQWATRVQKLLNELQYGTDDPAVISAVERVLAFRRRTGE